MYFNPYALASLMAVAGVVAGNDFGHDGPKPITQHRYHARVFGHHNDVLEEKESSKEIGHTKASGGCHDDPDEGCGHAVVVNKCPYEVWLWSVAHDTDGPYKVGCGEQYIERYYEKCGVALEVVKHREDWQTDENKLVFYYKIHYGQVLYDLYGDRGVSFGGHKLVLRPEDQTCPKAVLEDGYGAQGSNKRNCQDQTDLVLTLCEGEYHKPPGHPHPPPPHPHPPPPERPERPPPHGPPAGPPHRPPYRPPHGPPRGPPSEPPYRPPYSPPRGPPHGPPYEQPHAPLSRPSHGPPYEPSHGPPSRLPYGPPSIQHLNGPRLPSFRPSTPSPTAAGSNSEDRSNDQAGDQSHGLLVERDTGDGRWENDKPDWDTEAKCADCGLREKGVVAMFDVDADVEEDN